MKHDLFLCTFATDALKLIRKYGIGIEFNQFCISKTLDDKNIDKVVAAMNREFDTAGVEDHTRAIVHGPFTEIIPMGIDPMAVDFALTRLKQAALGTRKLGLNRMVAHTGYYPTVYFDQWHIKQSPVFWARLMEDQPEDFTLYIENVFDPDPGPMLEVLKVLDDPRVKLCLDVGHANAASDIPVLEWIRRWGPHIGHFHLHNNDGTADQHLPVFQGTIDMAEVLAAIDDYCGEATLTVESSDADESIAWLLERL